MLRSVTVGELKVMQEEKLFELVRQNENVAMIAISDIDLRGKTVPISVRNKHKKTLSCVAVMSHKKVALKVLKYKELREESAVVSGYRALAEIAVRYHEEAALFALSDPEIYKIKSKSQFIGWGRGHGHARYVADFAVCYHASAKAYALEHNEILRLKYRGESLSDRIILKDDIPTDHHGSGEESYRSLMERRIDWAKELLLRHNIQDKEGLILAELLRGPERSTD
jgi:hypothetical protein